MPASNQPKNYPDAVLISGASTGIGLCCATMFAKKGVNVFAGVRKEADRERLTAISGRIMPIFLDITDADSIRQALQMVEANLKGKGLDGLVNNAGLAVGGPMEFVPLEAFRTQLEVNVTGHVAMTQAFLPLLRQARGRIVNISSVSGLMSFPFMGPYCASKHALEALSDAMRMELKRFGIRVSLIEPGAIATPIWDKTLSIAEETASSLPEEALRLYEHDMEAAKESARKSAARAIPTSPVTEAVIHALTSANPKTRYVIGKDARLYTLFKLLPDHWKDSLISRKIGMRRD